MDEPLKALKSLKVSLALSGDLEDHSGDVDTLGDIGDIYTEIGDYERAGKVCEAYIFLLLLCVLFSSMTCVAK